MRNLFRFFSDGPAVGRFLLFGAGLVVVLALSLLNGLSTAFLLPTAASTEATSVDDLFRFMLIVGSVIALSITALLVYAAFVFKRSPGDTRDGPPVYDNKLLQLSWTAIPVVLVAYLSVYSFDVYRELSENNPIDTTAHHILKIDRVNAAPLVAQRPQKTALPPVRIEVQALQYAWIFNYPGGISVSELHMPVGRDVLLDLNSADVIHGFWIPEFRLKQDMIPGRTARLRLTANRTGNFELQCTHMCGTYHGAMRVPVVVESQADYDKWLKTQTASRTDRVRVAAYDLAVPQAPLQSNATDALITHLN